MELAEFVGETLKQIIDGVVAAQSHAKGKGAVINPASRLRKLSTGEVTERDEPRRTQLVEFDVAVTAAKGTEKKGGVGVFVSSIALGAQGQASANTQSVSRVKFAVPMELPVQKRHG